MTRGEGPREAQQSLKECPLGGGVSDMSVGLPPEISFLLCELVRRVQHVVHLECFPPVAHGPRGCCGTAR